MKSSNGSAAVLEPETKQTRQGTAGPPAPRGTYTPTPVGPEDSVAIELIWLDEGNHRIKELETHEETKGLMDTLTRDGQQQPIRVTKMGKGERPYRLVFGERRLSAAMALKWPRIRAYVSDPMSELEIESVRAIENLKRRNPELAEVCRLVLRMYNAIHRDGQTRGENLSEEAVCQGMAARLGQAVSWVRDHLRIGRCESSKKTWEYITVGRKQKDGALVKLPKQHAREIAKLADPVVRDELAEWCLTPDMYAYGDTSAPRRIETLRTRCQQLMKDLRTVPWKLDVLYAGKPKCTTCPSNSANDKQLFEGESVQEQKAAAAGICLNASCFEAKRAKATEELQETAREAKKKLIALKPAERKQEMKTVLDQSVSAHIGVRPGTVKQMVQDEAARLPAAAKAKKAPPTPARLEKKDLGPTPKEKAERQLEEAVADWGHALQKKIIDSAWVKGGRVSALIMLSQCRKVVKLMWDKDSARKVKSPEILKLIRSTAEPTVKQLGVLESECDEQSRLIENAVEELDTFVLGELALAWGIKDTPAQPKLEDFMPKAGKRGTCRVCGCTEDKACVIMGEGCSWVDDTQTLCSACVEKDPKLLKQFRAKHLKGKGAKKPAKPGKGKAKKGSKKK